MNYYQHHIGDFDRATRHLTRTERSIYRDLLDVYYDTEKPLTLDMAALCRKVLAYTSEEKKAVEQILEEFFIETDAGWIRIDVALAISKWQSRGWHPHDPENPPLRPSIDDWKIIRQRIFARDSYTCAYCGHKGGPLECDHVHPVSRGGGNEDDNLVTACRPCNRDKGSKTVDEWRAEA